MPSGFLFSVSFFVLLLFPTASAQVHYHENGQPWRQRARRGPDAVVEGWYYNLGITGLRAQLVADQADLAVDSSTFSTAVAGASEADQGRGLHHRRRWQAVSSIRTRTATGWTSSAPTGRSLEFAHARWKQHGGAQARGRLRSVRCFDAVIKLAGRATKVEQEVRHVSSDSFPARLQEDGDRILKPSSTSTWPNISNRRWVLGQRAAQHLRPAGAARER